QDMADVTMSIRELAASQDPAAARPEICRIALYLTGAESATIIELGDDDLTLVQTVTAGAPWATPDTLLTDLTAPAARAFTGGKAVLVTDIEPPLEAYGMRAGSTADPYLTFWQPFAAGGRSPVAVLALAWHKPMEVFPVRLTNVMEVLAAEAMAAIERADLLAQVEALARTDELTGLPNRRVISEELPRELERSRREGRPVCVAMLDLDHFKRFNDTHGHPAGDRLLAAAAATWRNALRGGTDLLARFGGEEFLVVLPSPMDGAFETVQRLRTSTPEDQTVSAGVAEWDGDESPEQLVARADEALYAAKVAGRDRVERAPRRTGRPARVPSQGSE
ncbi:MAG: sensor domain-containing diguanylate cyclase, partial [Candidatus Limnocylindrales bacterium]